jgi:ketosteroid isomerase-like protein
MPRFARLFQNPDEVIEAWRESLRQGDVEGALALWLDDDSITCVLPEGNRLSGHAEIRAGLERMLAKPLYLEPIACIEHITVSAAVFDSTEAVYFKNNQIEADFMINITLVLMQDGKGWRIAHLHASRSHDDDFEFPSDQHELH